MSTFFRGIGQMRQRESLLESRIAFSGRGELDVDRSVGISDVLGDARSVTFDVRQNCDSMVVQSEEVTVAGRSVRYPLTVYRFNGSEFYQHDTLHGVQRWIRAE